MKNQPKKVEPKGFWDAYTQRFSQWKRCRNTLAAIIRSFDQLGKPKILLTTLQARQTAKYMIFSGIQKEFLQEEIESARQK